MDRSRWLGMLVQIAGVLSYIGGMLLMLFAAIGVFMELETGGGGSVPLPLVAYAVIGLALVVIGRVTVWRYGRGFGGSVWGTIPPRSRPKRSTLEELGYTSPSSGDTTQSDPGSPPSGVVCGNCGTTNEAGYRFCRNCSSQLPG